MWISAKQRAITFHTFFPKKLYWNLSWKKASSLMMPFRDMIKYCMTVTTLTLPLESLALSSKKFRKYRPRLHIRKIARIFHWPHLPKRKTVPHQATSFNVGCGNSDNRIFAYMGVAEQPPFQWHWVSWFNGRFTHISHHIYRKKWVEATGAVGIQSKAGKTGGTYAHPEIFYHFKAWLFPEYQYALIQNYMQSSTNKEGALSWNEKWSNCPLKIRGKAKRT